MAEPVGVKITQLPDAQTPQGDELLEVVQGGESRKLRLDQIAAPGGGDGETPQTSPFAAVDYAFVANGGPGTEGFIDLTAEGTLVDEAVEGMSFLVQWPWEPADAGIWVLGDLTNRAQVPVTRRNDCPVGTSVPSGTLFDVTRGLNGQPTLMRAVSRGSDYTVIQDAGTIGSDYYENYFYRKAKHNYGYSLDEDATNYGVGAVASGERSTALGNYAEASGNGAVAVGGSVAKGLNSVAAGPAARATNRGGVAVGQNAEVIQDEGVGIGPWVKVRGASAVAMGRMAEAYGSDSIAHGNVAKAHGDNSIAQGNQAQALASGSVAQGAGAIAIAPGAYAATGGATAQSRISQYGRYVLSGFGDTELVMNALDFTNQGRIELPNKSAFVFRGEIVAYNQSSEQAAAWKFEGVARRGNGPETTVLVSPVTAELIAGDTGTEDWTVSITADTTLGCVRIDVTSTNAYWSATVHTSETSYLFQQ